MLLIYHLCFCLGRKIDMAWARKTSLVKLKRLVVNQNRFILVCKENHIFIIILCWISMLSYSLCLHYTFRYWYKKPQVYDTLIVFYVFYYLKLVLYLLLIEQFVNLFDWFTIFFKDKVLFIYALSIKKNNKHQYKGIWIALCFYQIASFI